MKHLSTNNSLVNNNHSSSPKSDCSYLKSISDAELLTSTSALVKTERELTTKVLHHLMEVERRRLYAARGYSSLFEYCTKNLGYSESAAQRRISSMRLLRELPELEEKINSGTLSLSNISQAQSFFRQEKIHLQKSFDRNQKQEILQCLEGKSSREAERVLVARSSEPVLLTSKAHEKIRPITASYSEIKFLAEESLVKDLERLKALLSHAHPNLSMAGLIRVLTDLGLKKHDPLFSQTNNNKKKKNLEQQKTSDTNLSDSNAYEELSGKHLHKENETEIINSKTVAKTLTPPPELLKTKDASRGNSSSSIASHKNMPTKVAASSPSPLLPAPEVKKSLSRRRAYIPIEIQRAVWRRYHSRCGYRDPITKTCCHSQRFLQIDHIIPVAVGGPNDFENLRLLCFEHNQLAARQVFGTAKMEAFRKRDQL